MDTQSVGTKGEDLATGLLGNLLWISFAHIDKVDKLLDQLIQLSKNNLSNYINAIENISRLAVSLVIDLQIASCRASADGCSWFVSLPSLALLVRLEQSLILQGLE